MPADERFPEAARTFAEAGPKQSIETVAAFMAHATELGRLAPADPVLLARHFLMVAKAYGADNPTCSLPMHVDVAESVKLFLSGALPR